MPEPIKIEEVKERVILSANRMVTIRKIPSQN